MSELLYEIENLQIGYQNRRGETVSVLKGASFRIERGTTIGLVGESGSGKSTICGALIGNLPPGYRRLGGQVRFEGREILTLGYRELAELRAKRIGLVPQNAGQSLNPTMCVGDHLIDLLNLHYRLTHREARKQSIELLSRVFLPEPQTIITRYPHELSGGEQQRIAIALALVSDPDVLILDEPTTGLDVTTKVSLLKLLLKLQTESDRAMLYVSHDLGEIANVSDKVGVMYAGEMVEFASTNSLFSQPAHAYTRKLLDSMPKLSINSLPSLIPERVQSKNDKPIIQITNLSVRHVGLKRFARLRRFEQPLADVSDVTLRLCKGETLALVGESGSGKTTIVRALAGLQPISEGEVGFNGVSLPFDIDERSRDSCREIQTIFQNPDSSLNPRRTVKESLERPLKLYFNLKPTERQKRVIDLLKRVRLDVQHLFRYPNQLSGGEKQRVAIARAFAANPSVILCDEITSKLDVSVQAVILDLLTELQAVHQVAYVFITHDLALVRVFADQIAVLYRGRLCEVGPTNRVLEAPFHPYTEELLKAASALSGFASAREELQAGSTETIKPVVKSGCPFQHRCSRKLGPVCENEVPPWQASSEGHKICCHIPLDELRESQTIALRDSICTSSLTKTE